MSPNTATSKWNAQSRQLMQFPVSRWVISDTLSDHAKPTAPCDALEFIFQPLREVIEDPQLPVPEKLKHLGALELKYTQSVHYMCRTRNWAPFKQLDKIYPDNNLEMCKEILKARHNFFEKAGDVIGVSIALLSLLNCADKTEYKILGCWRIYCRDMGRQAQNAN